ncbi:MAG: alcohol dehydrogenase catalytic domain-containing protein, partial [Chloroflexota bacterium]|nr:alcohol dehydrogenase catalytic domain-containing protein [Chloroflexota bacterium]
MRALVYYGNKDVRLESNWKDPKLLDDKDAIIKVSYTSICATDIEEWQFGPNYIQPEDTPVVHGHEITGEVIEIGKNSTSLKVGDKVAVNNVIHCNNCFWCLKGQGGACVSMKVAGFHEDGGLAEYMRWPSDHLIKVSDSIPDEHGALIEPTSVACHAIRKSGVRPGDNV